MPIIETRSIHKIYPNGVHANDDIDFAVEQGENGAYFLSGERHEQ